MAEGFEPCHVPQQSRRDKLRVLLDENNNSNCQIPPLYDPSIVLSSDLSIFQEINGNPFLYTPQIPRFLDHNTNTNSNNSNGQGNLSLSLSSLHSNDLSSSKSITTTTSCVPLGPFTGYSLILKRSKFLKPAQILLDELCHVTKGIYVDDSNDDASNLMMDTPQGFSNGDEQFGKKKSRLISMLDEVYHKYKQYHEQLQMVVASFESVAGLGNAAPFANIAIKTMSKHFKCLKDAIIDQLQFTTSKSSHGQINCERSVGISGKGIYCQRQETQPVWRPQRGLPERAVTVLRAWLFDHFLHPYPTDTDKVMLAKQTGLSRNQVSNWFINARVRLWKPMVEEIHMLETREGHNKSSSHREGPNNNNNNNDSNNPIEHFPMSNSNACESNTPSTSTSRLQDLPSKRTRNELTNIPNSIGRIADSINLSYGNLSTGVGGGVSLTLGLHQNSGNIGLSEPFPMNAARRFGIDSNTSSGRVIFGGFDEQNGQFGRNNSMIGGHFLHDFAG